MDINTMLTNDISKMIDYLDKVIYFLKEHGVKSRENEIAIQKLEEAVFWLTYGEED